MAPKTRNVICLILTTGFVLGCLVWFFLPAFFEQVVASRISAKIGSENVLVTVRRIGTTEADFGPLALGDAQDPWLKIDAIQLDYSPVSLIQKNSFITLLSDL